MPRFRLLSIDGGGIRGIVPAVILDYIEKQTLEPIYELFDGIAGTSTGAILALYLTRPEVKFGAAAELVEMYKARGKQIFGETFADRLGAIPRWTRHFFDTPAGFDINDLWRPRYSEAGRHIVFEEYFGQAHLSDALLPVFVTSYDTEMRCPVFFVSRAAHANMEDTYYEATTSATMLDAAMASSAAPTYFPPHRVARAGEGHYSLVDGGVFANNPAALAHAFLAPPAESEGDITLSLGTGSMQHVYPYEKVKRWGTVSWAVPALKMTFDGQSEAASIGLRKRLAANYLRIQGLLEDAGATDELDDCSPENLAALERFAHKLIEAHRAELDALCEKLV
jgi:uncharacterized protein